MRTPKIYFVVILILTGSLSVSAQQYKYGHLNSGALLTTMPEAKIADAQLTKYQADLKEAFEKEVAVFTAEYNAYMDEINKGSLNPVQMQTKEQELQKKQRELQQKEEEIIKKVEDKRIEMLRPIMEDVNAAIDEVAKENNYDLIFDTSVINTVLYAIDATDIMPLVKAKLGM